MASNLPFPPQTASTCRRLVLLCDGTAFECFPHVGCVPENVKIKIQSKRKALWINSAIFFSF